MNLKILLLVFFILILASCSSEEKARAVQEQQTRSDSAKAAAVIPDSTYTKIFNPNKDFIIYLENGSIDQNKKFMVLDIEADSIILRDNIVNGEVKWSNEYDISVVEFPGMIKKDDESIKSKYKFNVISRKKYK